MRAGLERLPSADPGVIDVVWRGEALGTLLWALQLEELPPYDEPFSTDDVVAAPLGSASLRDREAIELERESARLWHWRARTTAVQADGTIELPGNFASFDQLVAATAMRGFEQGLLPAPMRGDFRAYGKVYRHLSAEQHAEAHLDRRRTPARADLAVRRGRQLGRCPSRHVISTPLLSSRA